MTDVEVFANPADPRLGRHRVHDVRSRAFPLPWARATASVMHDRHVPIFDQGNLGSCTANAALGMLATGPTWRATDPAWTEADAVQLYREETRLDDREIPGHWEPTDTGSAGIYSCKALQRRGLITGYRHAFSTPAVLAALQAAPVSIGIPWLNSMMDPDRRARLVVDSRSGVDGGHQVCLDGIDTTAKLVRVANSWGTGWGDHGRAWLAFADLDWLLHQGGDAVQVVRAPQ